MYPSALFIPVSAIGFSVAHHFMGPQKVMHITQRVADKIADFVKAPAHPILANDMQWELQFIERMQIRPWVACFVFVRDDELSAKMLETRGRHPSLLRQVFFPFF